MRTIIHIGQHKTGTVSIQHYLQDKRTELAKEGLYVPDSLVGFDNPSHFILNVYALNQNRSSSAKEKLLATKTPEYFSELQHNLEDDIAKHYQNARNQGCKDIIWSNEGLYLLRMTEEYERLLELFNDLSSEVVCVCCFRETQSYKLSYMAQLKKQGVGFSNDADSYRYVRADSWLFDYAQKETILNKVFEETIFFSYNRTDLVKTFMEQIGYSVANGELFRLNVTKNK